MKKQVFNPYLPLYEYIPDGEPHIFDGRLYIYGSHDKFGAFNFCHNDYVTWSTPIDDLKSWKYPSVDFWNIAKEYKDLKIIIGIDAHKPERLSGFHVDAIIKFSKDLGLNVLDKMEINH